jgi:hypothetical protein
METGKPQRQHKTRKEESGFNLRIIEIKAAFFFS